MTAPETTALPEALQELVEDTSQRLVTEFQTRFDAQVVAELARASFEVYRNARVPDFVPLFVERATRERLQAQLR